eukprot:1372564-Karenia_brevis.AAC.1
MAFKQFLAHRRFIIENTTGSELFESHSMAPLRLTMRVFEVPFPQCALGLISPEGQLILKQTTFWTSSFDIVKAFDGSQCNHP